jgi:hypothetical protein
MCGIVGQPLFQNFPCNIFISEPNFSCSCSETGREGWCLLSTWEYAAGSAWTTTGPSVPRGNLHNRLPIPRGNLHVRPPGPRRNLHNRFLATFANTLVILQVFFVESCLKTFTVLLSVDPHSSSFTFLPIVFM